MRSYYGQISPVSWTIRIVAWSVRRGSMKVLLVSVSLVLSIASVRAEPSTIIDERALDNSRKEYKCPSGTAPETKTGNIDHNATAGLAEPSVIEHNWGYCQNLEFLKGHWTGSNSKGLHIDEWWQQTKPGELIGIRKTYMTPDDAELQFIVVRDPQNSSKAGARASIHQFDQSVVANNKIPLIGSLAVQSDGITIAYRDVSDSLNYFQYRRDKSDQTMQEQVFKASKISEEFTLKKAE